MPVSAQNIDQLCALAIGNAEEIERLLAVVTHIGKKGGMGYGRVGRWSVCSAEHTQDDVLAERIIPDGCPHAERATDRPLAHGRGWTPPYWYSPWWADCLMP